MSQYVFERGEKVMPSDGAMRAAKAIFDSGLLEDHPEGYPHIDKAAEIIDREMIPVSFSVEGARHVLEAYGYHVKGPREEVLDRVAKIAIDAAQKPA